MADGMQLPININDAGRCGGGFCTSLADKRPQVMLVPPKRVLPIVFIPGIMGSNLRMSADRQVALKKENNLAWRVDCALETARFASMSTANRQKQLDPDKTCVDTYDSGLAQTGNPKETVRERNSGVVLNSIYHWHVSQNPCILLLPDPVGTGQSKGHQQKALERGWGEVLFGSYGELLQLIEKHLNDPFYSNQVPSNWWKESVLGIDPKSWGATPDKPQKIINAEELKLALAGCWFPVHAMGYNWLRSNLKSGKEIAARIKKLIKKYTDNGFECKQVILISHSMGGLVARATTHPAIGNIEDQVLGVVHGVMPAIGAAITYKRIRCGFEGTTQSIPKKVLGESGLEVTAVLGNSQGGLELLPTRSYGNSWLKVKFHENTLLSLPNKDDPFEEIYKIQDRWYQLFNPLWINPANLPDFGIRRTQNLLNSAKIFHNIIDKYYHHNSYAIYGSDPKHLTWGDVVWQFDADVSSKNCSELNVEHDNAVGKLSFIPMDVSNLPNFNFHIATKIRPKASLAPPNELGDSTVPVRSANDQVKSCKAIFRQVGYEHQNSFINPAAISATFYSLIRIIQEMKWDSK